MLRRLPELSTEEKKRDKDMGPTEYVANWTVKTTYDDIPAGAKRAAQEMAFDCLGAMLAGSAQPLAKTMISYVQELGGKAEATVLPGGERLPAFSAALVNGTLGHALDYDDYASAFGHSASILLPALLALGEKTGASGRDLMEAFIIGHEVGESVRPRDKGDDSPFHKMPVLGRIGAAAACARLLKLDRKQVQMALGIAGSMASGVHHQLGTMTKPLHAGLSARDGVMAAELAARGWTAGERILEHPSGFLEAFFGMGDDANSLVERLGNPFRIQDMVKIKKYPCGSSNHYTIDALLELMKEHNFDYRGVEEVEIQQAYCSVYIDPINEPPRTGLQGKFSMVYNAAAALVLGKIDIDTFAEERINDPRIRETMGRVRVRVLSKWEISYARVERWWPGGGSQGMTGRPVVVRLKNGKVLSKVVPPDRILGSPKNPWGFENIRAKFEANARLVLPEHKVREAVGVWSKLEEIRDIREAIPCVVV
ncbi:MAG: MmgE/PrpD family protein [Chloroflexi bacterium]|nr:MmgE/PrpD family protein [Chloroflexota bacterium]